MLAGCPPPGGVPDGSALWLDTTLRPIESLSRISWRFPQTARPIVPQLPAGKLQNLPDYKSLTLQHLSLANGSADASHRPEDGSPPRPRDLPLHIPHGNGACRIEDRNTRQTHDGGGEPFFEMDRVRQSRPSVIPPVTGCWVGRPLNDKVSTHPRGMM